MQAILWPIVTWILREIVLKFLVLGAVFIVVVELVPLAASYVVDFISVTPLDTFMGALSPGFWFWVDAFRLDFALPLMISAHVSRFLIRRIPFIG